MTNDLAAMAIGLAAGGGFLALAALVRSYLRAADRVRAGQDRAWQRRKPGGGQMVGARNRLGED